MDQTPKPGVVTTSPEHEAEALGQEQRAGSTRTGYFRWAICTLLLLGTTKNYMDRQVLGVLKTTLQHDLDGTRSTTVIWCLRFKLLTPPGWYWWEGWWIVLARD